MSEFPLTIADLIGVFDRLTRRPLAVLLVAVDENDAAIPGVNFTTVESRLPVLARSISLATSARSLSVAAL